MLTAENSNDQTEMNKVASILKISRNIKILSLQEKLKHLEEFDTAILCEQLKNDINNGLALTTKDIIVRLNQVL